MDISSQARLHRLAQKSQGHCSWWPFSELAGLVAHPQGLLAKSRASLSWEAAVELQRGLCGHGAVADHALVTTKASLAEFGP